MRNIYPKIFVLSDKTIQWSLKMIYPYCQIVSNFEMLLESSDKDFICLQVYSESEIQELLWNKIRLEGQKLSPVILIGFQLEGIFLSKPENLIFKERPYEYRYLSLPISLRKLLLSLTTMQPVYDKLTLKGHIKRYATIKEIVLTHLHHIKNYIYRNDLERCIVEFEKIGKLLLVGSYGNINFVIAKFKQNPTRLEAERIKNVVSRMINEK